ncbi:probable apyrase 3 [Asparagus officinalis]|uniref:probable apyrase 3 n=1 Tax=Asparagus officinalis TaxID=4686 RepID=UPI00098E6A55|nr:probable apyrase 3 [Asparagus officinalis]
MVGDGVKEMILESCRGGLRGSGFRFQDDWASVISGSDEGIFAWVAANYALALVGDPLETTGIMELGGASAQASMKMDNGKTALVPLFRSQENIAAENERRCKTMQGSTRLWY